MSLDPRFQERLRQAYKAAEVADGEVVPYPEREALLLGKFLENMLPDWAPRAACAGKSWLFFKDEVADRGELTWFPETTYDAMRVCATCPLQRECLEWAYEMEKDPHDPWTETTDSDNDRYGVFAVPGRIRERFAGHTDRVDRCLAWLHSVATSPERRWLPPDPDGREKTG